MTLSTYRFFHRWRPDELAYGITNGEKFYPYSYSESDTADALRMVLEEYEPDYIERLGSKDCQDTQLSCVTREEILGAHAFKKDKRH